MKEALIENISVIDDIVSFVSESDRDHKIGVFKNYAYDGNGNEVINRVIFWYKNINGVICIPFFIKFKTSEYILIINNRDKTRAIINKDNFDNIKNILSSKILAATYDAWEFVKLTPVEDVETIQNLFT